MIVQTHVRWRCGMDRSFEYRQRIRQEKLAARRRAAVRRRVRFMTTVLTFAVLFISIISANAIIANAGVGYERNLEKMYTSIIVERNDTVWDIAAEYTEPGYNTIEELVEEISYINSLDDNCSIQSGMMLMVPYYAEG